MRNRSIRCYKRSNQQGNLRTPLAAKLREKICAEIEKANRESGLPFVFAEDAGQAFNSMGKSYGLFSGMHSVAFLKVSTNLPGLAEKTDYYGECLMLDLTDMGLETCWVDGAFDRRQFGSAVAVSGSVNSETPESLDLTAIRN